ncbi:MAG: sensor histidine kinase, partial [Oscillatoriales cyanobacterium]
YAMQGDREKCLAVGMNGYITKPIRTEDLREVLERVQQWRKSSPSPKLSPPLEAWEGPTRPPLPENQPLKALASHGPVGSDRSHYPSWVDRVPPPVEREPVQTTTPRLVATSAQERSDERSEATNPKVMPEHEVQPKLEREVCPEMASPDEAEDFPVIDRDIIHSLAQMAGSRAVGLITSIIQAYQEDAPAYYAAIQTAIETDDADGLRKAAHTLRSSSANLGGLSLANVCKQLEDLGRAGTTQGSAEAWPLLQHHYGRFLDALKDLAIEIGA